MSGRRPDEEFTLELVGPGAEPDTVRSADYLAFVAAYFELLERMSEDDDNPLRFQGVAIENKCIAVRALPNDKESAKRVADISAAYLHGVTPPNGLKSLVNSVRQRFREFGPDYAAKVMIGTWEKPLIVPGEDGEARPPASIETIRATVLRVGGVTPRVRAKARFDREVFSIDLTKDQAQALAPCLYADIDMTVRIQRTVEGVIAFGQLLEFTPVTDEDPSKAMQEWFRPHAEFWDKVTDISEVLGRRDRS
jgi:hypothetical protein